MSNVKRLTKQYGYRYTAVDFTEFEYLDDTGILTIDDLNGSSVRIDLTELTLTKLITLLKEIKEDRDGQNG